MHTTTETTQKAKIFKTLFVASPRLIPSFETLAPAALQAGVFFW